MIILGIRTDAPEATVCVEHHGNYSEQVWHVHRTLSDDILRVMNEVCTEAGMTLNDIDRVVVYEGPGSFTGLRIGVTVANTLASSIGAQIVGVTGDDWFERGKQQAPSADIVLPVYGSDPHITLPKK